MSYDDWGQIVSERFPAYRSPGTEYEWNSVKNRLKVGDSVVGTVIAKADFGAWIDLGLGFPALLEIIFIKGMNPELYRSDEWCPVGTQVRAFVCAFNDGSHQIGLRQFTPPSLQSAPGDLPATP